MAAEFQLLGVTINDVSLIGRTLALRPPPVGFPGPGERLWLQEGQGARDISECQCSLVHDLRSDPVMAPGRFLMA